jgi:hypothetical protein
MTFPFSAAKAAKGNKKLISIIHKSHWIHYCYHIPEPNASSEGRARIEVSIRVGEVYSAHFASHSPIASVMFIKVAALP